MAKTNKLISNVVGGEISPLLYSRVDIPLLQKAVAKCENFIVQPQGGASFRCGSRFVKYTRYNRNARFIPFQFSDQQAYLIEATDKKFRFYKDEGAILETSKTITGVSNANPATITAASHGFSVGDEVYISGVIGSTELQARVNGRFFLVLTVPSADTFTIGDIPPANSPNQGETVGLLLTLTYSPPLVNTTSLGAYTSGGTVARVYEIDAPYLEQDIEFIQHAQDADTMYASCYRYDPRKITRTGHASWSCATYSRAADPFAPTTTNITAMTSANPGVFTTGAVHGLTAGDEVYITGTGTAQIRGKFYLVKSVPTTTTFDLYDESGNVVNTSNITHANGNTVAKTNSYPAAVCFLDSARLALAGTRSRPSTVWASKAPNTSGTTAYDDFTTGSNPTDGIAFTLATIFGKVDAIQWMTFTNKFLVIGTFGSIRRIYGTTEVEPISPTSVTAKSVTAYGCAFTLPISNGSTLFYIQRNRKILRSMEYDYALDGYTTTDRNLVSEHITNAGISEIIEQQGQPDIAWARLANGRLAGLTYKDKEDISGWFRCYMAGQHTANAGHAEQFGKVIAIGRMPREDKSDQMWLVVERNINGATYRSVEFITDAPNYPIRQDFFTDENSEDEDDAKFENASYEAQKDAVHLDMSLTYDGSIYGSNASAAIRPSATTGASITIKADNAVFDASMVDREIWHKYDTNGGGGGRALITAYVDDRTVTCKVKSDFETTGLIPAGNWFLTTNDVHGLDHLEGETVGISADGGPHVDGVVSGGHITLNGHFSKVTVGLKYTGEIRLLNIDTGGVTGTAQSKVRTISKASLRFNNTVGALFGTSPYNMDRITFRRGIHTGRPTPPFTGIVEQPYQDTHDAENKIAVLKQDLPMPCTILGFDLYVVTTDEGY